MTLPTTAQLWANYPVLSPDPPTGLIWGSSGAEGSGKSKFGLSAPDPIWVGAFDTHGMNRVAPDFRLRPDGTLKDIRISRYPITAITRFRTREDKMKAADELWHAFMADYRGAMPNIRTAIIDREDIAWWVERHRYFGTENGQQKDYGPLYIDIASIVQEACDAGISLGFLRGQKPEWAKVGGPTGRMLPDGCKTIPDLCDVTLVHRFDEAAKTFHVRIDKFTDSQQRGEEYGGMDFAGMATLACPTTELEAWQ